MIHLSDITLNEASGSYQRTCDIMFGDEGLSDWMLTTDASIITDDIASNFILHAWNTGDMYIFDTDHPPLISVSDAPIRELKAWSEEGGWRLCVADRLLKDPSLFQFWLQKYRETLVYSSEIESYDKQEAKRMTDALEEERIEDAEERYIGEGYAD